VQIFTRLGAPSTYIVAFWTLADQRVLVRRFEWLTLLPARLDFKQISHLAMIYL
jgi:hypothetical protein